MKINPYLVNQYYKPSSVTGSSAANPVLETSIRPEQAAAKVDRLVLSRDGSNQGLVSSLSKRIVSDIIANDSPERIGQLRAAIREGTYSVSTDELARSIMAYASI